MATYTDPSVLSVNKPNRLHPGPIIALVAGLLALAQAGFFYYQGFATDRQRTNVEASITGQQAQLTDLQPVVTQLAQLAAQTQGLHLVFDNQIRWENVLGTVQQHLYKDMIVTALQINDQGSFSLAGETPDYTNYAKLYRSLTDVNGQKIFGSVKPVAVVKTKDAVQFSFTLGLSQATLHAVPATPVPTSTPQP